MTRLLYGTRLVNLKSLKEVAIGSKSVGCELKNIVAYMTESNIIFEKGLVHVQKH